MRKFVRFLLVLVLLAVALDVGLARLRTHDWSSREWVAVYPIAGDNTEATARYLAQLDDNVFEEVETFFSTQAERYGISAERPVDLQLRQRIYGLPPAPPAGGGALQNAWWSLRLRYWAWQATRDDPGPDTRIRMFLVFHDPEKRSELPHSLGLRELLVGVAYVFSGRRQQSINNVVIAHELMHTLGASDKYHPATNQPLFPEGYAEPQREPLHPQRYAEIMGGRIPVSPQDATIPASLRQTVVGEQTAREIAWTSRAARLAP